MNNVLTLPKVKCEHGWTGAPSRCNACRSTANRLRRAGMPDGRQHVELIEGGRVCLKCKQGKSWDEFAKDVHGYNQRTATCKPCRNRHLRENYPDKRGGGIKNRPDRVMRLYGVTYEYIVQTLANQFGRCANHACSKEISLDVKGVQKNRAVVDHCHATGKFRAILCVDCNCLLGQLETKSERVLGLMDYMNKHRQHTKKGE